MPYGELESNNIQRTDSYAKKCKNLRRKMQACPGTPLHTRCGTSATNKEISKIHVRVSTNEHTYGSPVQGISMIQFFYRDGSQASHGSDLADLSAGVRVRLHSLQAAAAQHNGVDGHLLKWNASTGRWGVKLSTGQELSVRPENMMPTSHAHAAPPFLVDPGEKLVKIRTMQGSGRRSDPWSLASSSLYGCQFYTDSGRVSEWFGSTKKGWPGSFAGSAEDPISDIQCRATRIISDGFCPMIARIETASGTLQAETRSDRADLLELLDVRSIRMNPSRALLLHDAANIDPTKHYLELSTGKRTCSICLEPTVSPGALCCGGESLTYGVLCQKWVCEGCYSTLMSRHLAKPVLQPCKPGDKTASASPWMARNSLENKAVAFCLSQLKTNAGPGAMSTIPEMPELQVLRHIIELADPWHGQETWSLCTCCNKILCPSCPQEVQQFVTELQTGTIREPTFPCCSPCADVLIGDEDDLDELYGYFD